jgi:AraC-like DNA-binding protein
MALRGTVSALLVRRIVAAGAIFGADPDALAASANLSADALADPNARLPHAAVLALWTAAERHTGDPDFGIHCAELNRRTPANALAFAVATSASLARGLACIARYVRIAHDDARIRTRVDGALARVEMVMDHELGTHRHGVEFALALVALIGREHVGPRFALHEVAFTHPRPASGAAEHARVFGRPPRFASAVNELVFDRALLDHPFDQYDAALHAHLGRHLDELITALDAERELRGRVQKLVTEQLRAGGPDVDDVARKLRLGSRTLQRRLQQEGTSFQGVVNAARRDVALRYLGDRALSLTEVAFLLGFTEPSNFHRAFKRWTGTTPAEARRRALEGDGDGAHGG